MFIYGYCVYRGDAKRMLVLHWESCYKQMLIKYNVQATPGGGILICKSSTLVRPLTWVHKNPGRHLGGNERRNNTLLIWMVEARFKIKE